MEKYKVVTQNRFSIIIPSCSPYRLQYKKGSIVSSPLHTTGIAVFSEEEHAFLFILTLHLNTGVKGKLIKVRPIGNKIRNSFQCSMGKPAIGINNNLLKKSESQYLDDFYSYLEKYSRSYILKIVNLKRNPQHINTIVFTKIFPIGTEHYRQVEVLT
jgi:hypothetical protein